MRKLRVWGVGGLVLIACALQPALAGAKPPPLILETSALQQAVVGGSDEGATAIVASIPEGISCSIARRGTLSVNARYKDKELFTGASSSGCSAPGLALVGGELASMSLASTGGLAVSYKPRAAVSEAGCVYEASGAKLTLTVPGPASAEGPVAFKLNKAASVAGCAKTRTYTVQAQLNYAEGEEPMAILNEHT